MTKIKVEPSKQGETVYLPSGAKIESTVEVDKSKEIMRAIKTGDLIRVEEVVEVVEVVEEGGN